MTNSEYHAHAAISKSDLDLVHRSPMHFQYRKNHPLEQTTALLVGSAVHKMVLEPETFDSEFVIAPDINRRTKNGKEEYADFLKSAAGKSIITKEIYRQATDMAEAISHHPTARKLLTDGKAEQSYFWDDLETGAKCKCRPDYIRRGFCVDYKTTQDASPDGFQRSAYNYRYHVQAYWYLHGLAANGITDLDFVFIAQEKEPPYAIAVYYADEFVLKLGEQEAKEDLQTLQHCIDIGSFSGYPDNIQPLGLPHWAARVIM